MVFNIWKVGGLYEPLPVVLPHTPEPAPSTPISAVQSLEKDILQTPSNAQATWIDKDTRKKIHDEIESERKVEWKLREDWTAAQFMSFPVVTLSDRSTLKEAWDIVVEKRFRHIPVVDDNNRLVGLISDRDLLKKAALMSKKKYQGPIGEICVSEAMSKPVIAAEANTLLRQIALIFLRRRIGCMPITDREGHVIGILNRSDLLRIMLGMKKEDVYPS